MISRKVVDFFAHQCGARDQLVAEREVVLTYALHLLSERRVLDRLAFKGGTALRKLVFGAGGRFSEDLDFTLRAGEKEDAALALLDALDGKTHHGITFGTTDFYETDGSFATFVTYRHSWNDKGATLPETKAFDVERLRALVVLKLWQVREREPFGAALFEKLRSGRYDWDELHHLLPPGKTVEVEHLVATLEDRFRPLVALRELERRVVADAPSGWNHPLVEELRARITAPSKRE